MSPETTIQKTRKAPAALRRTILLVLLPVLVLSIAVLVLVLVFVLIFRAV
jgi:hypothetical protein